MAASTGYLNNPDLPAAGTKHNWTQQMVSEYIKCSKDPIYFLKTYVKIVHLDKGIVPFEMYSYQEELAEALVKGHKRIVMNTARQAGKTSGAAGMILHYICFNSNKRVAIVAQDSAQAQEIVFRIQEFFISLPAFLKSGVKSWNKRSFSLDNGNSVISGASNGSALRGKSINLLLVDEMAWVNRWSEFAAGTLPVVSSSKESIMVFLSTPNGMNQFYEYVDGARKGTNGFKLIEAPWWKVPGRDEDWKQKTLGELNHDIDKFNAEFCCEFVGSSGTLISGSALIRLKAADPVYANGKLFKYADPIEDHTYVCVADTSRGRGLDYSAFHVIDVTTDKFKQVVTFRDNEISPSDYATMVYNISNMYNEAFVLVEVNDIGGQVVDQLHEEYEYENIIYTETKGRSARVSGGFGKSAVRGLRTTKSTKKLGCAILKLLVEQQHLELIDKHTIDELGRFSKKGDSYEAEDNCHDDMVMGLVFFAWLSQDKFFTEITNKNTMKALREFTDEQLENDLLPFGFKTNGLEDQEEVVVDKMGDMWALDVNVPWR